MEVCVACFSGSSMASTVSNRRHCFLAAEYSLEKQPVRPSQGQRHLLCKASGGVTLHDLHMVLYAS